MANKLMLGIASVFLLLGLGSLIVGIVLPITLHNSLVNDGKDLSSIHATDNANKWSNIPGDRGYNLTNEFEFFEITNPNEYKYGMKPIANSVGTVVLKEKRNTTSAFKSSTVTTFDGKEEVMLEFNQIATLKMLSDSSILQKQINTPNPEVFAQLAAIRDTSNWYVASQALKQIIDFTVNEYYSRSVVAQMIRNVNYYNNFEPFMTNLGSILVNSGMTTAAVQNIFNDTSYGFIVSENIRVWVEAWNTINGGLTRKMLLDFFDINYIGMNNFMTKVCLDYSTAINNVNTVACISTDCTGKAIFYKQWANVTLSNSTQGSISMTNLPQVKGKPEIRNYINDVFMLNASDAIKTQFKDVDFLKRQPATTYAQLFDSDTANLYNSLYNFTTMKTLFEVGDKIVANSTGQIDVSSFNVTTTYTQLNENESYVLYKYLVYLSNNTYLLGGSTDVAAFGTSTAPIFRSKYRDFVINFGSEIIGLTLFKYLGNNTWTDAVLRLFPTKSSSQLCSSGAVAPNTKEGLLFWVRLYIGRKQEDIDTLTKYTSYTMKDVEAEFDSDSTNFHKFISSILDALAMGKVRDDICDKDYNFLCSLNEIAMNQWLNSTFTNPVPDLLVNDLKPSNTWVESFQKDENTYLKTELNYFIKLNNKNSTITQLDCFAEVKSGKLFEPLYLLSIIKNQTKTTSPFSSDIFILYLGVLYRNSNFPALVIKSYVKDLLYGVQSQYLTDLQKKPLVQNGLPMVSTSYRASPYPNVEGENIIKWKLLTGEKVEDFVRRVYSYNNNATYATATKYFYHNDKDSTRSGVISIEYQPWSKAVYLSSGSDSIQYEPNIGQKSDISYYATMYGGQVDLDYDEIVNVYDIKTYEYIAKGNFYKLTAGDNPYYNLRYDNAFNATAVSGSSMYVTFPFYSNFGDSSKSYASQMLRNKADMTFNHDGDTKINIELYSGLALKSREAYQINYVFDGYANGLDKLTYFAPAYIYTINLSVDEGFATTYFDSIKNNERTRKLVLIVWFAVGGVLFALGISACIIIFIRSSKEDSIPDEDERKDSLHSENEEGKKINN